MHQLGTSQNRSTHLGCRGTLAMMATVVAARGGGRKGRDGKMDRTRSMVMVLMKVDGAIAGTAIAINRITMTMASPTPDPPPAAGASARVVAGAEAGAVAGGGLSTALRSRKRPTKKENKRKTQLPGQEGREERSKRLLTATQRWRGAAIQNLEKADRLAEEICCQQGHVASGRNLS